MSTRAEIADLEQKLERYFEAFEEGALSPADCHQRVRGHRVRLETLREQEADPACRLATTAATAADGAALAALADELEEILATAQLEQRRNSSAYS